MGTAKTYIPAYGTNTDKYWFPMKIAKSRALLVCEILDEEKIDYFLPTNDEANGIWLVIHHDYYHTHNCYHKKYSFLPTLSKWFYRTTLKMILV